MLTIYTSIKTIILFKDTIEREFKDSMKKIFLCLFAIFSLIGINACSKEPPLVIYSGKGLKNAVDEAVAHFEKEKKISTSVVYAGSNSILETIQGTQSGDIFISGSKFYIDKLGKLIINQQYIAKHIPVFVVNKENSKQLQSFSDLSKPGVKIALGNKDMAAIGKVSQIIIEASKNTYNFRQNVAVEASTVNELLSLVLSNKVDAAIIWEDMLTWKGTEKLQSIRLPEQLNRIKEIWVAELGTSTNTKSAKQFFSFIHNEGAVFFEKHGFVR